MPIALGIDLGTTNSLVAWVDAGVPRIVPNRAGGRLTASVVGLDPDGRLLVGESARRLLTTEPDRSVAEVKRLMGSTARVRLGDRSYTPTEISGIILRALAEDAALFLGQPITEAVVTVPAYFTDAQRQATKDAGELASLRVERILNEPTAAALAYGLDHLDAEQMVVVYDLGGGTLDVSVLEMFQGVLDVKASAGNNRLGGTDFDELLANWLANEFERRHGIDLKGDPRSRARLKQAAERAKQELSTRPCVVVELDDLARRDGESIGLAIEVSRAHFEALVEPLVAASLEPLRTALADASLDPRAVSELVLVGGCSRIPVVRQRVAELLGREPRDGVNPDEAIALGAAAQAGLKSGAIAAASGILLTDVCPFTLGVEVSSRSGQGHVGGLFSPIIGRNATIPCSRTETYSTTRDGQRQVAISVYQGESRLVRNNVLLDQYTVEGIPPGPAGSQSVAVSFNYDINGILRVMTKVQATGQEFELLVDHSPRRLQAGERDLARRRLEAEWAGGVAAVAAAPTSTGPAPAALEELLAIARVRLDSVGPAHRSRLSGLLARAAAASARNDRSELSRLDVALTDLLFELDS